MAKKKIKIMGEGCSPGGEVDIVTIMGSGEVTSDVRCEKLKIFGEGRIKGIVDAQFLKVTGQGELANNVIAKRFKSSGEVCVKKDIQAQNIRVIGHGIFEGSVKASKVKMTGGCDLKSDMLADHIIINGQVTQHGMLSAEEVLIRTDDSCTIKEIGATKVVIRELPRWLNLISKNRKNGKNCVRIELIEADEIAIKNTHADIIRGKHIEIGKGCKIQRIEYSDTLKIDDSAVVAEKVKV